ncbi:FadR/GntR family transcriptional regulator [Dysosmobacter sp.]|uniref:FadR/GntR family transcriptional regulator n=1 Tax=Dysosmobacter sp. TaxID=2591382 RepID=UPI002A856D46|nr:FadR/GntR family transcriptional regulator [Dysosmobacter sp.]MDY3281585.1 FadR/GntR family transcriptional regulator [Dysosmobacter sp.]
MAELQKIAVSSTVDEIVNQIIQLIIDGTFLPGQRIPTESELARSLGVGRNSVREAVKVLCAYGILEIRRADGTYVCSSFSPKLINPFIYGIILEKDPCYLIELRDAIENYVYYLAAKNVTDEDLISLKAVLDRLTVALDVPSPDVDTVASLDSEFHSELAKCGHNPILTQINQIVCLLLHKSRRQTIENMIKNGQKDFLISIHQKSYQAILNRDLDNIADISHESIFNWSEFVRSHSGSAVPADSTAQQE